jgi:hypothetical protein
MRSIIINSVRLGAKPDDIKDDNFIKISCSQQENGYIKRERNKEIGR